MKGEITLQSKTGLCVPVQFDYNPATDSVELLPNEQFTQEDVDGFSYAQGTIHAMAMISIWRRAEGRVA